MTFISMRKIHIYREKDYKQLNYNLNDVLPGTMFIKTNMNTYNFLKDLNTAKEKVLNEGKKYSILPDNAITWAMSEQPNPISLDWPSNTELANEELVNKIANELRTQRGQIVVIVQKYEANSLALGFKRLSRYKIVDFVKKNFNKTGETVYFELYE